MTTDEFIPSPTKSGFASDDGSRPRKIGATRRPYAIICQGTSEIVAARPHPASSTPATVAAVTILLRRRLAGLRPRTHQPNEGAPTRAAATARAIRSCCEPRVPMVGIRKRLKTRAPAIDPAVLAA